MKPPFFRSRFARSEPPALATRLDESSQLSWSAVKTSGRRHCAMHASRVPVAPARPRAPVARAPSRRRGTSVASAALPPANEVAGFIIGAGLVGLVFAASRLDGIIAKAQIRGFEDDKGERWRAEARANGGNIFVVPEDDEK